MQANAAQRLALVLGNSDYLVGPLANPTNDARLMTSTLEETGFEVTQVENGDLRTMQRAIVEFGRKLRAAGGDAIGMVYYAGHAVQAAGENYLIPVDATIQDELDLPFQTVEVATIMQALESAENALNIVVLDACRNNPFRAISRSGTRGLAKVDAPQGTLLAYSTAPGAVALDGNSDNSPYTAALANVLKEPGLPVEQVFKKVRIEVMAKTDEQQVPWESSSLTGDFFFTEAALVQEPAPSAAPTVDSNVAEIEFWRSIASENDAALFQSYLDAYPNGLFSGIAEQRIATLQSQATSAQAAALTAEAKSLWDSIKSTNDPALFATLVARYPNTVYAELAQARIRSIEVERDAAAASQQLAEAQSQLTAQNTQPAARDARPSEQQVASLSAPVAPSTPPVISAAGLPDGEYLLELNATASGVFPWCRNGEKASEEIEIEDGKFSGYTVSVFGADGRIRIKLEEDGTVSGSVSGYHWENSTRWEVELKQENGVWKGLSEDGGFQERCKVDFALTPLSQ